MKYAIIENGCVTNVAEAKTPLAENWVLAPAGVGIGYTYDGTTWTAPIVRVSPDKIREQRDELLSASDWTQVADAPVDQAAWATYRQALRDIPAQDGFPDNVVWPTQP